MAHKIIVSTNGYELTNLGNPDGWEWFVNREEDWGRELWLACWIEAAHYSVEYLNLALKEANEPGIDIDAEA